MKERIHVVQRLLYFRMVNSMVYYGLSLSSSSLAGNPYVNFIISGAVEIPSYIVTQLALRYLGRRWPISFMLVVGGLSLLLTLAVPTSQYDNCKQF